MKSRRAFLTGATAITAVALAIARANTPFTQFPYPLVTGGRTLTTPQRLAETINVMDYGTPAQPVAAGSDDTGPIRAAISDAFGICSIVGDTGGVSSTTLNVTAVNYGTIQPGRSLFLLGGSVFGTVSGNVITYVPNTIAGTVAVGQVIADQANGLLGGSSIITAINRTTHQITYSGPTVTISTGQPFYSFTLYDPNPAVVGSPPTVSYTSGGGTGGTGQYTLSHVMTIAPGTPLWVSNSQSHPELNKVLRFPAGNYNISDIIVYMALTNPIVVGEGSVQITYGGIAGPPQDGSTGNPIFSDPSYFPMFALHGVNGGTFENIALTGSPTFGFNGGEPMNKLVLTSPAAVGANSLTFATTVDPLNGVAPTKGMVAWDIIDGKRLGCVVDSVTSTVVNLRGDKAVTTGAIPANSTIVFTPPVVGLMMEQSFGTGYCGAIKYRGLSLYRCGRGIFTNGGFGNCDNCSLDECFFNTCTLAGLQLEGYNVLNWQSRGGGAANCGHASTCDPATNSAMQGNFGAGYSLVDCGCQIDSTSCSANTWDVVAAGTQGVIINAGRGEQMGIAPHLSEFTGYITAGTPSILTVTAFTRGEPLQPGTIIYPTFAVVNAIGAFGVNGAVYITGPAASGGGSGGVGNYNLGVPGGPNGYNGSVSWPPAGPSSPQNMCTPGIGRGQSIYTDSAVIVNEWGFGSGVPGITNGEESRAFHGGNFILNGVSYGPQGLVNAGWFVYLINGTLVSTSTVFGGGPSGGTIHSKIFGNNNARLFMRNDALFIQVPPHLFDNFGGKIYEFTPYGVPDFTVAMLTTTGTATGAALNPSAIWQRCRLWVTDYSVPWGSGVGAPGTPIAPNGGGTHTVPVICPEGTAWVVSG